MSRSSKSVRAAAAVVLLTIGAVFFIHRSRVARLEEREQRTGPGADTAATGHARGSRPVAARESKPVAAAKRGTVPDVPREALILRLKELGRDSTLGREEKRREQQAIVLKLAKELDFEACRQVIADAVGDGEESMPLISALFEGSADSFSSLLDRVTELAPAQSVTAVTGLSMRSQQEGSAETTRLPLYRKALEVDGNGDGKLVPVMIRFDLAVAGSTNGQVAEMTELAGLATGLPPEEKSRYLTALIQEAGPASPFETWNLLKGMSGDVNTPERRDELLAFMVGKGPARMMDAVIHDAPEDAGRAYQVMATANPKAAEQWLVGNQARLGADTLARIQAAVPADGP